jgi:predicted metal-dependent phosphoesterase TrpH
MWAFYSSSSQEKAMSGQTLDMHMHSTFSDGWLSTEELLLRCQQYKLRTVALTDHDTIAGVDSATVAGRALGIKVIPGCEISVNFMDTSLHLLAYQFDLQNTVLKAALSSTRHYRIARLQTMVAKLSKLGFLTPEDCLQSITSGSNVGLRHVVRAIISEPRNQLQLEITGAKTENAFIRVFLEPGRPAHTPRETDPPIEEAIALVHQAGGLAVIAHPGLARPDQIDFLPRLLCSLKERCLDGVESFYGQHNDQTTRICHGLAIELDLFETAGSDFHHSHQENGELGTWKTAGCQPRFPDWVCNI